MRRPGPGYRTRRHRVDHGGRRPRAGPSRSGGGSPITLIPNDLVGVWRLLSFLDLDDSGRGEDGPLGPDPDGFLVYTADGHVTVSMMRTRPGSEPNYLGYAGHWRIADDGLRHRIVVSSRPDWVGVEQLRDAELDGKDLLIGSLTVVHGQPRHRVLHWRRQ